MKIIKYNKIYDNENNWTQSSNIINIFFLFLFSLIDKQNFYQFFLKIIFPRTILTGTTRIIRHLNSILHLYSLHAANPDVSRQNN